MRPALRRPALLAVPLVAVLLAGCSGDDEQPTSTSTAPVVQPGLPGEEAQVLPPRTEFTATQEPYDAADVAFVTGMIPHHEQALEMALLAPGRAADESVRGLASRIADVQGAEIDAYRAWLEQRDLGEDGRPAARDGGHAAHEDAHEDAHEGVPGMATPEELDRLEASSGAEFDRLWLELMVRHHEAALGMAQQRAEGGGLDVRAEEMAADVYVTQLDEIERMQAMLAG